MTKGGLLIAKKDSSERGDINWIGMAEKIAKIIIDWAKIKDDSKINKE